MDEDMSPLKKLIQISQGRRLHRSRCPSVTSTIDALRTTKETIDEDGFIGEAFSLKSKKSTSKVTSLCCVGKEQMTSYSVKSTEIAEERRKDCKNPQIPNE